MHVKLWPEKKQCKSERIVANVLTNGWFDVAYYLEKLHRGWCFKLNTQCNAGLLSGFMQQLNINHKNAQYSTVQYMLKVPEMLQLVY